MNNDNAPDLFLMKGSGNLRASVHTVIGMYDAVMDNLVDFVLFSFTYETKKFTNTGSLKIILEETIHQCLPDPNDCLYAYDRANNERWVLYLFHLLSGKDPNV